MITGLMIIRLSLLCLRPCCVFSSLLCLLKEDGYSGNVG
jgi:hypothetical protein